MRKTRKVLDWEGFGWIPPYVTSTQSRPVATVYSDVRVGSASRFLFLHLPGLYHACLLCAPSSSVRVLSRGGSCCCGRSCDK